MARLRDNVLANYAGQLWIALMGVAFVPLYIRALGAENFGLVGFMLSLQAIALLLDFGVGVFMGRELARRVDDPIQRGRIRQLIRTFEWLVWPTAALIAVIVTSSGDFIATHWLRSQHLSQPDVARAVMTMGPAIALLWPSSFYASALTGLEQQPRLNMLAAVFATLRYAGVLPVLYVAHAGLQGFLWWYVLVAALQTACSAVLVWRLLPPATEPPRFHAGELLHARQFALGIFVITATSLALSQVDRLTVSVLRPLAELGYYTVAVTVSGGFGRLVQPMFNAIYPRMSRLVAGGELDTLRNLYQLASQGLAVVVSSTAIVLVFYSREVLRLWTGDAALASRVAIPMSILIAGSALNGLMNAPYALLLAHGRTRLPIVANVIALLLGVPFCYLAVQRHGMTGAAMLWLAANLGYVLIVVPLIHHRFLGGANRQWYLHDVVPALSTATAVTLLAKWLHPMLTRDMAGVAWIAAIGLVVLATTTLASGEMRKLLWQFFKRRHGAC